MDRYEDWRRAIHSSHPQEHPQYKTLGSLPSEPHWVNPDSIQRVIKEHVPGALELGLRLVLCDGMIAWFTLESLPKIQSNNFWCYSPWTQTWRLFMSGRPTGTLTKFEGMY